MGQEIDSSHFAKRDFERFRTQLKEETRLLEARYDSGALSRRHGVGGFELEAWLVDRHGAPVPCNAEFLRRMDSPLVVPELAKFNVEINGLPHALQGDGLRRIHRELEQLWGQCRETAAGMGAEMAMIGILPTADEAALTLRNMSDMARYRALNRQVLRQRHGRPLTLDIAGKEHLHTEHRDVMLESAATSFQVHLQVDYRRAAAFYNASLLASAPLVAAAANSPYLFGKDLWDETRIPVFEQAVAVGGYDGAAFGPIRRVTFGTGYVRSSLMECFRDNLEHYPVLLPVELHDPPEQFSHVRLHNGTIWRWNRPLIGFDPDGRPHLRIEHRVIPAGPTLVDSIANAAFYYGLVTALAEEEVQPETQIEFGLVRDNFYAAAKRGLQAIVSWPGAGSGSVQALILDQLLPRAEQGLQDLQVREEDIQHYLGIVAERVQSGRNGTGWQRAYVAAHDADMHALMDAYLQRQHSGAPVHTWSV